MSAGIPLLYDGGELANALTLLTQDILSAGCFDDDLGTDRCHSYLTASIAILSKLTR